MFKSKFYETEKWALIIQSYSMIHFQTHRRGIRKLHLYCVKTVFTSFNCSYWVCFKFVIKKHTLNNTVMMKWNSSGLPEQSSCCLTITCSLCLLAGLGIEAEQIVGMLQKRLALLTGKMLLPLLNEQVVFVYNTILCNFIYRT